MTGDSGDRLKLRATDLDDLAVIGAMLQDALVPVADLSFQKDDGQFLALFNRFCWEAEVARGGGSGGGSGEGVHYRTHAALRFDAVEQVQYRAIDRSHPDQMLSLLAVAYDPDGGGNGRGAVVLQFAGKAAIRLTVSRLLCGLEDMGERWPTRWKPGHAPDGDK